jgi:preprotein translocase subunit SecE
MSKIIQFLREVRTEMTKVVWPSRKDTMKMTIIVVVFSVVVAFYLGFADYGLAKLVQLIFNR